MPSAAGMSLGDTSSQRPDGVPPLALGRRCDSPDRRDRAVALDEQEQSGLPLPRCMERDSESVTAAFHGCRSAVGADCAPADASSSSVSVAALALELAPVQPGEASAAARVLRGARSVPIEAPGARRRKRVPAPHPVRQRQPRVPPQRPRPNDQQPPSASAGASERRRSDDASLPNGLGELRLPWDAELSPVTGRRVPVAAR
jgi:hypothetical protein